MNACIRLGILLIAALGFSLADAHATRVTPMVVELDESGTGSSTRVEVANTDDEQLPIEVRVFSAEISELGEPTFTPADEDFLVFPPQAILEPGMQQVFRLQYLGSEPLSESKIYYMSVRQVPVELEPGVSKIQIIATFNVLVNVVPRGAEASIRVDWAQPAEREGQSGIEVRVVNDGTKYFSAGRADWTLKGVNADARNVTQTYRGRSIGDSIGYGVVPAGGARIFFVPTDQPFSDVTEIDIGR